MRSDNLHHWFSKDILVEFWNNANRALKQDIMAKLCKYGKPLFYI